MLFLKVLRNAIIIWFISLVAAFFTKSVILSLFSVALTGAMPFIVFVLWLGLSPSGESIRSYFDAWHAKTFLLFFIFCYGLFGGKWAGDIINQIFQVDPSHFQITNALLTILFTPFGVLYRQEFIGGMYNLFMLVSIFVIPYYIIYLLAVNSITNRWKKIAYVCAGVFLTSAAITMTINLSKNFLNIVETFAIWADFSDHHMCTDPWVNPNNKVVFLEGDRVLLFSSNEKNRYSVQQCNYRKSF